MSPNVQILVGYVIVGVCAVIGTMGGIMVKQGYERRNEAMAIKSVVTEKETLTLVENGLKKADKQNNIKIAKVKINRIIDDAKAWLQEKIEQNRPETDKLIAQFNARGVVHSGMHIAAHIDRLSSLIKTINDYIKDMNRKIEDEVLMLGEEKFETVVWLKDEFTKYQEFIKFSETAKDNLKLFNNDVCLRFTDKPTFENILKSRPYRE